MSLADDFRRKATENIEGSGALFDAPDFGTDAKKQTMAVIGQVNATIYSALADVLQYERLSASVDSAMAKRREIIRRNDAIRQATAKGDWNEFDRLVAELASVAASGAQ